MSKIKNGGLDQYGAGSFEQQQFGTAGDERVNTVSDANIVLIVTRLQAIDYTISYELTGLSVFGRRVYGGSICFAKAMF